MSRSPVYEIDSRLDNFLAALCLRLKLCSSSDILTLDFDKYSKSGELLCNDESSEFMVMLIYDEFSNSKEKIFFNMNNYNKLKIIKFVKPAIHGNLSIGPSIVYRGGN
jgi:hypothetical protein